jgi:tetratricopeptide (TPR) repeat protein
MRDLGRAMEMLSTAVKLNPTHSPSYFQRGLIFHEIRQYTLAVKDYTMVIGLNPKSGAAYYNRALAYHFLKQYEKSIADYESSIAVRNTSIHYTIVLVFLTI